MDTRVRVGELHYVLREHGPGHSRRLDRAIDVAKIVNAYVARSKHELPDRDATSGVDVRVLGVPD
jgi:hypothetical protein